MARRQLLPAAGLVGAGLASTLLADALDRRKIAADPVWKRLSDIPVGETRTVAGGGGTPIHVELHGPADAPPVVLIHGWICSTRFWQLQVQDLRADHRVIAYDVRGHGVSGAPADGDWSLDTLADDLEAVLDACVDGPALLAGHSLGAMTIAAWGGRHRTGVKQRARAVALINTGLGDLISESLLLRTPNGLARVRQLIGGAALGASLPLPPRPDPISHRIVKAVALDRTAGPGAVRLTEQMALTTPPRVRAGCGRELSKLALLDRVEHLAVPSTVIYGDHDLLTPKAHALRLAEALPDCRDTIELHDCGHMGPLERPAEVTAALRAL